MRATRLGRLTLANTGHKHGIGRARVCSITRIGTAKEGSSIWSETIRALLDAPGVDAHIRKQDGMRAARWGQLTLFDTGHKHGVRKTHVCSITRIRTGEESSSIWSETVWALLPSPGVTAHIRR